MKNQNIKYLLFVLVVSLWSSLCFVLPDFLDNPHEGIYGLFVLLVYVGAIGLSHFLLFCFLCSFRIVATIILPLYAILGAGQAFYRVVYKVSITPLIIDTTLHTNTEEAVGVMSWQLFAWVVANLIIALCLVWYRRKKILLPYPWIYFIVGLIGFGLYTRCHQRLHLSIQQRYPMNIIHASKQYISSLQEQNEQRTMPFYHPLHRDDIKLIFVMGEAVRADHLGINGYLPNTTPFLKKEENLISFPFIRSPHTHTTASIPYILTRADSVHPNRATDETSFTPILNSCGYQTYWISNQDLGGNFAYFPNECDSSFFVNKGKTDYVFHPWVDEDLLPIIHRIQQKQENKQAFLIHTIGSHWYYNNHVPQEQWTFQPVTTNRLITANTEEQIIHSYDNTILYMDSIVEEIISFFREDNAILIYLADHSESLGEGGRWLHASDAEEQKHPACFIWYSDSYEQRYPDKIQALQKNRTKHYGTDFLFYSILSAVGIEAQDYDSHRDVFADPINE